MTELSDLRAEVLATRGDVGDDTLRRVSADGLAALFNKLAPADLRISHASSVSLAVRPAHAALTGRQVAALIDHFSRAVASIAQELSPASMRDNQLSPADYSRAPVYPVVSPGGSVIIAAGAGQVREVDGTRIQSRAEAALVRLANLLPASEQDPRISQRVLSARVPAARAMQEVAVAARRVGGLTTALRGSSEDVESVVDPEQARMIEDLLKDTQERVTTQHVIGRLDGMRFSRREFFLDLGSGHDLSGLVDESQVAQVRALLDRQVAATVERVVRVTASGRHQRPAFRLVALASAGESLL